MGKKSEYKREVKETSDGSTNVDIELEEIPNGYKRTIQHIAVEDETSAYDYLRIGYKSEYGVYHWWVEEKSPAAATLYWMSDPKILQEDDRLVIRFNGTEDGDVLAAYIDGFTEKVGE